MVIVMLIKNNHQIIGHLQKLIMLEDVMPLLKKEQDAKEMQVAEVDFAGNIKMITMKKLILLLLFIPLVSLGQKIYIVLIISQGQT